MKEKRNILSDDCFFTQVPKSKLAPQYVDSILMNVFYQMRELQEYLGVLKIIVIPYLDSLKF